MKLSTPPKAPAAVFQKYPWLRRELWIAGSALLAGLIVMPFLIYLAGRLTLGAYAAGGLGTFLKDYTLGLLRGSAVIGCVVLGPYLFLSFMRGVLLISRRYLRPTAWSPTSPQPSPPRGAEREQ